MAERTVTNTAPWPYALEALIARLNYREGWTFELRCVGDPEVNRVLCLDVLTRGVDSYDPGNVGYRVHHFMQVPPATYNEQSWRRWLFDQIVRVETHEACEFFKIDGRRPYAPHHGPGQDPYVVFERGTDEEARTMFTGEIRPKR